MPGRCSSRRYTLAINNMPSTGDMLKTITPTRPATSLGAHQAITLYIAGDAGGPKNKGGKSVTVGSFSEHYVDWCNRELEGARWDCRTACCVMPLGHAR